VFPTLAVSWIIKYLGLKISKHVLPKNFSTFFSPLIPINCRLMICVFVWCVCVYVCTQIGELINGNGCADWLQKLRSPVEATIGLRLVLLLLLRRYCQFRPEGRCFAAALLLLHPFMNINALQLSISSGYWCHRGYSYSIFSCAETSKCPFLSKITI